MNKKFLRENTSCCQGIYSYLWQRKLSTIMAIKTPYNIYTASSKTSQQPTQNIGSSFSNFSKRDFANSKNGENNLLQWDRNLKRNDYPSLTKSWFLLCGYNPDFCKLSWPWLFKRWMALSTGYITIHWIMLSVFSEQLRPEVHSSILSFTTEIITYVVDWTIFFSHYFLFDWVVRHIHIT